MPDCCERLTVTKVALLVSPLYQKETCTPLKAILFKINVITMEIRKGSIIAKTVHQEKSQALEISHLIAAQVDNAMINMETKESAEH